MSKNEKRSEMKAEGEMGRRRRRRIKREKNGTTPSDFLSAFLFLSLLLLCGSGPFPYFLSGFLYSP